MSEAADLRTCRAHCGRELPADEFYSYGYQKTYGDCKRCASDKRNIKKREARGEAAVVEAWKQSGCTFFSDWMAQKKHRERCKRTVVRGGTRRTIPTRKARLTVCALVLWVKQNPEAVAYYADEAKAWGMYNARARYGAKLRERRRLNPQQERAKSRRSYRRRGQGPATAARRRGITAKPIPTNLVWEKSTGSCGICGEPVDPDWWAVDHILPIARGGAHMLENVCVAHAYCNLVKGKKTNDTLDVNWLRKTRVEWEASLSGQRARDNSVKAPHGTINRYYSGCRCRPCKDARTEESGRRRAQQRGGFIDSLFQVVQVLEQRPLIPTEALALTFERTPTVMNTRIKKLRAAGVVSTRASREGEWPGGAQLHFLLPEPPASRQELYERTRAAGVRG